MWYIVTNFNDQYQKNSPTATNNKTHPRNCNYRNHLSIKTLNLFKNLSMKNKWYKQNIYSFNLPGNKEF